MIPSSHISYDLKQEVESVKWAGRILVPLVLCAVLAGAASASVPAPTNVCSLHIQTQLQALRLPTACVAKTTTVQPFGKVPLGTWGKTGSTSATTHVLSIAFYP